MATHGVLHFDEASAMWLFELMARDTGRFTWRRLPQVAFMDGDAELEEELGQLSDLSGTVLFGTGDSARNTGVNVYDEHLATGRMDDQCTATLVAEDLGLVTGTHLEEIAVRNEQRPRQLLVRDIAGDPGVEIIVREALRCDTLPGVNYFQWAQLMKMWHVHGPQVGIVKKHDYHVYQWTWRALSAVRARTNRERPYRRSAQLKVPEWAREDLPVAKGRQRQGQRVHRIVVPAYASASVLAQVQVLLWYGRAQWHWPRGREPRVEFAFDQDHLDRLLGRRDDTMVTIVVGIEGGQIMPGATLRHVLKLLKSARRADVSTLQREFRRWERQENPDEVLPFELPSVIDALNTHTPLRAIKIWDLMQELFETVRRRDNEWANLYADEYERMVTKIRVGRFMACMVHTELPDMFPFARQRGNQVVMIRRPSGNVFIGFERRHKHVTPSIAAALVVMESMHQELSDGEIYTRVNELEDVYSSDRGCDLPGLTYWHYHLQAGGTLLNGSRSHEAPPTPLSDGELMLVLAAGLAMSQDMTAGEIGDKVIAQIVTALAEDEVDAQRVRSMIACVINMADVVVDPDEEV